jgi:hypothetical protein
MRSMAHVLAAALVATNYLATGSADPFVGQ